MRTRPSVITALIGIVLALAACSGGSAPRAATSRGAAHVAQAGGSTQAVPTATPGRHQHKVLVILLENHSRTHALSGMPHLAAWARRYGQASDYHAVGHPSLPNYLAIWGGSTFGVHSDYTPGASGCTAAAPSVFGQTLAHGRTARAYQESMTRPCQRDTAGRYAARHSPWPYWPAERRACLANDVPSGTLARGAFRHDLAAGALPVTGELTPDFCDDGHDCPLSTTDTWLGHWVPAIMAGPDYRAGRLTVVITFDEDDYTQDDTVAFVVIDPRLHRKQVTGAYTHYSLTRWLDENAGVPLLRNAAHARSLRTAFGL